MIAFFVRGFFPPLSVLGKLNQSEHNMKAAFGFDFGYLLVHDTNNCHSSSNIFFRNSFYFRLWQVIYQCALQLRINSCAFFGSAILNIFIFSHLSNQSFSRVLRKTKSK